MSGDEETDRVEAASMAQWEYEGRNDPDDPTWAAWVVASPAEAEDWRMGVRLGLAAADAVDTRLERALEALEALWTWACFHTTVRGGLAPEVVAQVRALLVEFSTEETK